MAKSGLATASAITKLLTELKDSDPVGVRISQLVEVTGLQDRTIYKWLNIWHRARFIRICAYHRNPTGGRYAAVFCLNLENEADVPYPKNKGTKVYSENYRARKLIRETLYGVNRP